MKYILMMQFQKAGWETGHRGNWAPEQIKANMEAVGRITQALAASGELVSVEGLGGPEGTKAVQAQKDGSHTVTDGPFPEAKEFLAGFWIVNVSRPERAYEIAAQLSAIPGPAGTPANIPIIVRPVMTVPLKA